MNDISYMKRAIELAHQGLGRTAPNPPVGAVIVKDDRVIGEGFHPRAGMPHAEIHAIDSCSEDPAGATLYVTLEPCCHHGKTPPCTDTIIKAGIRRVVYAIGDPNPLVSCRGKLALENAGIEVTCGVCSHEAEMLCSWYIKWMKTGLPYVTIKAAVTLDGCIAASNGDSRWISSEESRRHVHGLRNKMDAILVGIGTVLADDPLLTCRIDAGRDPLRIIIDRDLRLPSGSKCLGENCIIITSSENDRPDITDTGTRIIRKELNDAGRFEWRDILGTLGGLGIHSVLVEGGSSIISGLIKTKLVDRIMIFIAPKILGSGIRLVSWGETSSIEEAINLVIEGIQIIGGDIMIKARIKD